MQIKDKLVSANAVRNYAFNKNIHGCMSDNDYDVIIQAIDDAGDIVRHAQWHKQWCDSSMIGHMYEECPVCGCLILDTEKFWDCAFCPNCGTCMDGEESFTKERLKTILRYMERIYGEDNG